MIRALVALAAVAACKDKPASTSPLPGTVYVVEGATLVRYTHGTRSVIGDNLFASSQALPDGRVVAISSRGDGAMDSEQLALISPAGIERLGPTAMQVRDPAVDPRGRWITVAANTDGHSDLFQVEVIDGAAKRLTNDPQGNFHPAILGDAIVYVSSRDGDSELYTTRGTRLTAFHRDDWNPAPSPRGDTLAFLSDREGPPRIFLVNPDGTSLRRLTSRTDTVDESAPTWSRDGRYLAYVAGTEVWLHDTTSGAHRMIAAAAMEPAFSPDSQWLAVAKGDDVIAIPMAGGDPITIAKGARLPRWF